MIHEEALRMRTFTFIDPTCDWGRGWRPRNTPPCAMPKLVKLT